MLTISPTLKLIINRTVPLTLGVFSIMLVQLVDTIFIGQLGIDQLTVQGLTLPFYTVIIGLQVGIGVAATCIISQAAGAKQTEKATTTASITVIFGTLFITLVATLLWLLREQVFSVFISPEDVDEQGEVLKQIFLSYWPVWLFSTIFSATLYLVSAVYRANQDTKSPGMILVVASVINLILDPILIFVLDMGIIGAAIASTIAFSSCAAYMWFKARNKGWFSTIRINAITITYFTELIRMVIPTTMNQILPSVSTFFGMLLISTLGVDAIAFWSLLSRTETFLLVFTLSLTMSVPPMIGKALGEGNAENISNLLNTTAKFVLVFHTSVALIVALSSDLLVPIMSDEAQLIEWMKFSMWIIPFSYGPLGLCMIVVSAFNALGIPKRALLLSFARLFVFYLPAIWIGTQTDDVPNTIVAASLANLCAGMTAWKLLKRHPVFNKASNVSLHQANIKLT
ncbi:MATE family efflux transporter [Vibrio hannami]|uniref:MATE family efflux transporter n=1 Tax=Vibrio hannami TaxID=2717094 RepID=UPI00240F242D|nr:MATE family efflux transporter [Vibrio hannami]MDG3085879.1 MATE family efflux transporter [Vibrio hannami]